MFLILQIGEKSVFTKELEVALADKRSESLIV